MLFRSGFWFVVVAASGMLAGGCHTSSHHNDRASADQTASSNSASTNSLRVRSTDPQELQGSLIIRESNQVSAAERNAVDAHAHYSAAVIHELNGNTEQALDEYYEAALGNPEDEQLVLEVSRRFLQVKQTDKALELVSKATALPGATGALYARLGFIYAQSGKQDLAISANRMAIRKEPQSLMGYQNLFLIHLQSKQIREALSVLDDAARAPRTDSEFLIGLAELYGNLGLQEPAQMATATQKGLVVLQRAAKTRIDDPQLLLRLANCFSLLGNDPEASRIYRELLAQLPDAPFLRQSVQAKLANIYLRQQDHKQAIEQLEAIVRDNPTDAQAYYFLGSIAYDDNNYAQAIDNFSKALLLTPDFEPVYYDLASAQLAADKAADAQATLEKARQKFQTGFTMEYLAGMISNHEKDFTNAVKHFTSAEIIGQATDPKRLTHMFYFQFGAACERQGDYTQAEKYFEKCLELSPNFDEAQNYLGFMWADRGENLDRARALIEKALKTDPKSAAYLDSMGWVLFKLNRPKDALPYMLDALKNSEEEDATLYDHLGDIYAALNQPEKARESWAKSLAIEKNDTVRAKLDRAVPK